MSIEHRCVLSTTVPVLKKMLMKKKLISAFYSRIARLLIISFVFATLFYKSANFLLEISLEYWKDENERNCIMETSLITGNEIICNINEFNVRFEFFCVTIAISLKHNYLLKTGKLFIYNWSLFLPEILR